MIIFRREVGEMFGDVDAEGERRKRQVAREEKQHEKWSDGVYYVFDDEASKFKIRRRNSVPNSLTNFLRECEKAEELFPEGNSSVAAENMH